MLQGWLNTSHFSPWVSWHSELPFFTIAIVGAAVFTWKRRREGGIELPFIVLIPISLTLLLLVQSLCGLVAWYGQALVVALYLLLAVIGVAWGWGEGRGEDRVSTVAAPEHAVAEWLAWTIVVAGILSLGVALVQVFRIGDGSSFIAPMSYLRRPGGNMAQPNHLASLLVMAVSSGLFLHLKQRMGGIALTALVLYAALGVAVTESRTGLLAMFVVLGFWSWKRPSIDMALSRSWAILPALFMASAFVLWPLFYKAWFGGFDGGEAGVERLSASTGDPRLALWSQLFQASLLKPWSGWGIRDTAEAHHAVAHESVSTLSVTYSHNLLVDLVVWLGWPLALGVAAFAGIWMLRRLTNGVERPLGWFGMATLLPFAVHSLLEFPYAYAYFLLPVMMAVGYLEAASQPYSRTFRVPRSVGILAISAMALVGAWSVVDYLRAEEDFRVARFEMLRIGSVPTEPPSRILLLNQLGDLVASTRIPLMQNMTEAQLVSLRLAAQHNPWSGTQYRYATALAFNGQPLEARRQLQVIRAQHGFKVYRVLGMQLEQDLAKRGLPSLNLSFNKPP